MKYPPPDNWSRLNHRARISVSLTTAYVAVVVFALIEMYGLNLTLH